MRGSPLSIRWGWVLLGALGAEAATLPVGLAITSIFGLVGLKSSGTFDPTNFLLSPPIFFLPLLAAGFLVARRIGDRFALHGAAVGLIAALVFLPILVWMPWMWEPAGPNYPLEAVNEVAKIFGGALGGYIAAKTSRARVAAPLA